MPDYAIYLRKSRADLEAEARGEGETLARHRKALLQLAESRGLNIVRIYEEIATGDTISARPQMQALLSAVENGDYAGVIVNDADRLARGDGIDQGIVKQAFYSTGTQIITPFKTYDPGNEADEDFFEFSLFMARFEYRKIKQRMQTGRARSAAEGNYLGPRPVFGYERVPRTDRRGWMLKPVEKDAEVVRMIFNWYAYGENGKTMSANIISNRLNEMGLKTLFGHPYTPDRVRKMLVNPAYIGQVSWNKYTQRVRRSSGGAKTVTREKNADPIIVENAHPAIIDRDLWDRVQGMFKSHARLPKNTLAPVVNVLAGIVKCGICGYSMQRKPGTDGRPDMIACITHACPTTAIYIPILEEAILDTLAQWLDQYAPESTPVPAAKDDPQRSTLERQIATLNRQMDSLHDLLEQGIYTPAVFVQRRDGLQEKIQAVQRQLNDLATQPTTEDLIRAELPQIRHVLSVYFITDDLESKNQLLRSVISRVEYHKTEHCYRNQNPRDYLEITVFPANHL